MRFVFMALLALFSPVLSTERPANPRNFDEAKPSIALKLVAEKSWVFTGETLKLRAEILNTGDKDVIVAQHIDSRFGNSELTLYLESRSKSEDGVHMSADGVPEPDPDFEKTFVTNWLTLSPGHFYGAYVDMDPGEYPMLCSPGSYEVRAEYHSRGISSTPGWNGAYLKQEDVEKLPFVSLKGTLVSNILRIQVRARTKTTHK